MSAVCGAMTIFMLRQLTKWEIFYARNESEPIFNWKDRVSGRNDLNKLYNIAFSTLVDSILQRKFDHLTGVTRVAETSLHISSEFFFSIFEDLSIKEEITLKYE
jgi:hypothetical protein